MTDMTAMTTAQSVFPADAVEAWDLALATLTHDLRTPLASLLALVELRRARTLPDAGFAEQVADYAGDALALTDDLLRLLRETRHAFAPRPLSPVALGESCVGRLAPFAAEAGVLLDFRGPSCGTPVMADDKLLPEALDVLARRAIAACQSGGRVRLHWLAGPGEHLLHICVPVMAGEPADSMAAAGPALLFARRVLARHGGTLAVLLEDGRSGWRVSLP